MFRSYLRECKSAASARSREHTGHATHSGPAGHTPIQRTPGRQYTTYTRSHHPGLTVAPSRGSTRDGSRCPTPQPHNPLTTPPVASLMPATFRASAIAGGSAVRRNTPRECRARRRCEAAAAEGRRVLHETRPAAVCFKHPRRSFLAPPQPCAHVRRLDDLPVHNEGREYSDYGREYSRYGREYSHYGHETESDPSPCERVGRG